MRSSRPRKPRPSAKDDLRLRATIAFRESDRPDELRVRRSIGFYDETRNPHIGGARARPGQRRAMPAKPGSLRGDAVKFARMESSSLR
jgi:hypothetical protein